jgi:3-oxoacyl-[acyl-carrier protein] reductase
MEVIMKPSVLITGASRGIGEAIAYTFAEAGFRLAICCCNSADRLAMTAETIRSQYHTEVLTFIGDVGDFAFVQEMSGQALAAFGQIDVLINNAGISYIGLLTDMTIEEWNTIVSVNLTSVFSTCKCIVPSMVQRQSGKIINISSVWGNVGASCEAAYSACKGGMNAFTKALGKELAPSNIQVNAIACGCIDTSMNHCFSKEEVDALCEEIPAGRFGQPQEVAQLALQLAHGNDYLTGQIITLDGGWT